MSRAVICATGLNEKYGSQQAEGSPKLIEDSTAKVGQARSKNQRSGVRCDV
jgi:hypothetical protein